MVQAQKTKKKSRVAEIINQLLEDVNKARTGDFTPEKVARFIPTPGEIDSYERAGLAARRKREPKLAKATPKLVVQKAESREERMLDQGMERRAVIAAVDLATALEMSANGRELGPKLKRWISG